jgi:hypothetical protein
LVGHGSDGISRERRIRSRDDGVGRLRGKSGPVNDVPETLNVSDGTKGNTLEDITSEGYDGAGQVGRFGRGSRGQGWCWLDG